MFKISNSTYDKLKIISTTVLPAIAAFYLGLSKIWGLGYGEEVDATIALVITALNALLGAFVIKSSSDYKKTTKKAARKLSARKKDKK